MAVCLFSLGGIAQDAPDIYFYNKFKDGQTAYLLADRVNVRTDASTSSKVIAQLPIGEAVKIIDAHVGNEITIKGYSAGWSKIEFLHKEKLQRGYIWSGLLAIMRIKEKKDKTQFLFGVERLVNNEFMNKIEVQLRAAVGDKELDKIVFDAIGDESYYMGYTIMDGKGLKNIQNIIRISFNYDACDYPNGYAYVFWTGKKFIMMGETVDASSAGLFGSDTEVIFPADKGGKKEQIITIRTMWDEFNEDTGEYDEVKKETAILHWDGKAVKK